MRTFLYDCENNVMFQICGIYIKTSKYFDLSESPKLSAGHSFRLPGSASGLEKMV